MRIEVHQRKLLLPARLCFGALGALLLGLALGVSKPELAPVFNWSALLLWFAGMLTLAEAKGWHWAWGLLGLTLVGGIAVAFLPDRRLLAEGAPKVHEPKQQVGPSASLASRFKRRVPVVALLICATLTLFPPWVYTFSRVGMATVKKPAPRAFIFLPPSPEVSNERYGVGLDGKRLLVEILAICLLATAVFFWAPNNEKAHNPAARADC